MRSLLSLVLLLAPVAAEAAPAPLPPRPASHAEVAFDAGTTERARLAAAYLRSDSFVEEAALDDGVASRLPVQPGWRTLLWLMQNLRVSVEGAQVRLRVGGGPYALPMLEALTARLSRASMPQDDDPPALWHVRVRRGRLSQARQVERLRALRQRQPDRISEEVLDGAEARLGWYEIMSEPLILLVPPRPCGSRR